MGIAAAGMVGTQGSKEAEHKTEKKSLLLPEASKMSMSIEK